MIGKSYGAVVQWQAAVQQLAVLTAIVVRSADDDVYTGFTNPGGCIRPWMFEYYCTLAAATRRTSCCRLHRLIPPFALLRLTASPHSFPAPETLAQPTYRLELDLVNDTVSCVL